jgi:hypothetical protein
VIRRTGSAFRPSYTSREAALVINLLLVFLAGLVVAFEWSLVDKQTVRADHDSAVMSRVAGGLELAVKPVYGW